MVERYFDDNTSHKISSKGTVALLLGDDLMKTASDVLHILVLIKDIGLISKMNDNGVHVAFNKHDCKLVGRDKGCLRMVVYLEQMLLHYVTL